MLIDVTCRNCGSTYRVSEQFAGRQAVCRNCGAKIPVPVAPRVSVPTPQGLDIDPLAALEAAKGASAPAYIPTPSPDAFEPPPAPRRRRPAPSLHLSDSTTKLISIGLLIAWAVGSLWAINATLARVGQSLPQEMVSKLHTVTWLNFAWTTLVFFIVFVPAILITCAQACSWTKDDFPESPYLRAAGAGALPGLIFILLIKFIYDHDLGSAVVLALISPIILIAGLRLTMNIKWSSTFVTAAILLVVVPLLGWAMRFVNAPVQSAIASMVGLTPQDVQAARQEASSAPRQAPGSFSNRPSPAPPPAEAPRPDPLLGKAGDLLDRLKSLQTESASLTREAIQPRFDALSKELSPLKPTEPSEIWNQAVASLNVIQKNLLTAPSGQPPADLTMPIKQPLAISKPGDDAFRDVEYRFKDVTIKPLKDTRIDVRAYAEREKLLRWKLGDEREDGIELTLKPVLDDGAQQRPWIATRPMIEQIAASQKLFAIPASSQARVTYGQINGIGWTRIDGPVPGTESGASASPHAWYVALVPSGWLIVHIPAPQIAATAKATDRGDAFINGLRLAGPQDTQRSPFDPALVVEEFSYRIHDDPAPALRDAGDVGLRALRAYCSANKNDYDANVLLRKLTQERISSVESASPGTPKQALDVDIDATLKKLITGSTFERDDALKELAYAKIDESKRDAVDDVLESMMLSKATWHETESVGKALELWWRPQTAVALIPLLEDENGDARKRQATIRVLAVTKDKKAVFPIVRWIIKEPEAVVAGLKTMGPVAEDEVVKLLRDRNADVRRNAARILEEIGTQKCLLELRRASADPRDPSAALAAKQAVDTVMARVKEQKAASQPATKPTTRGR